MGSIGEEAQNNVRADYDVLCIGAGLSGVYTTYRLRELGLRGRILEAGSAEGGTWYWNRYPGARFDSESYSYQFFFDKELMNEWDWQEHFSGQPEILAYTQHVVDKFDLRKDMQFDTRIQTAKFDEDHRLWVLHDQNGKKYTSRWLITAIGILTTPTLPNIPGIDSYQGEAYHTARWPKSPVSFQNKRVAVIGTGATGIQTIQEVAKTAGHLTVFQRRPNWACPMHNAKIDAKELQELREWYPEMMNQCHEANMGFLHPLEKRKTTDVSPEDREAIWKHLYNSRGFGIWFSNFWDINVDREANKLISEFVAGKIRQRVNDPETAKKLIPTDHGFATRRVPLETNYYEVYNQPNVRLVSAQDTPIVSITGTGVKTTTEELDFDMIIFATGFDGIIGSFEAIDFRGIGDTKLQDLWRGGPKTYLGFTVEKFPNMFMIMGPHQAYGNYPRSVEYACFWITEAIRYFEDHGITYAEAKKDAVDNWFQHVQDCAAGSLTDEVDSWMTGINHNVGKSTRFVARYAGTNQEFRRWCNEERESSYRNFELS